MNKSNLHGILKRFAETRDVRELFRHFADDVEFRMTITAVTPTAYECRGKQAVIDHFMAVDDVAWARQSGTTESIARGERFVVTGDDNFALAESALGTHSEYALVFDIRDSLITRFVVYHELSALLRPRRSNRSRGRASESNVPTRKLEVTT